jgi:hypothetical protein
MICSRKHAASAEVLLLVVVLGVSAARSSAADDTPSKEVLQPPRPAAAARNAADPAPRPRRDTPAGRLLNEIETVGFGDDAWAQKVRALIEIGPEAVPDLIAELDATTNDRMLRVVGFALRGIGDKRAVAPLIRAIPKTLLPPGSDMGLTAKDKDLLKFMQKHDLDPDDARGPAGYYGVGRPVREICGAIRTLTGKTQNEEELYSVFRVGSAGQMRLQKRLYYECAERWADWWTINWSMFLKNKDDARVNLAAGPEAEQPVAIPHGPNAAIAFSTSGHISESVRNPKAQHVFFDLDTGRGKALPESLRDKAGAENIDAIAAWATREGFDLMGTEYEVPGSGEKHFVIRSLGMTAWHVDNARWETIDHEITREDPVELGTPAAGLLSPFDEKTGSFNPEEMATFLFVTREGTCGMLFVGAEVTDTNVVLGVPVRGDQNRDPVGFYKGRRFGFKIIAEKEPEK